MLTPEIHLSTSYSVILKGTFGDNDLGEEDVTALQWLTVEGSNPVVNIEIGTQNFWHITCLNVSLYMHVYVSLYMYVCIYLCIIYMCNNMSVFI